METWWGWQRVVLSGKVVLYRWFLLVDRALVGSPPPRPSFNADASQPASGPPQVHWSETPYHSKRTQQSPAAPSYLSLLLHDARPKKSD